MKCLGMDINVDSAYLFFFFLSSTAFLQIFTEKLQILHLKDGNKIMTKSYIDCK